MAFRGSGGAGNNVMIGNSTNRAIGVYSDNTFIGNESLLSMYIGNGNTSLGYRAGRFTGTSGANANTQSTNSIFIGANTRARDSIQTNQIVIGTASSGLGSNTTVLGNSTTTQTWLGGSLTLGTQVAPAARLHVVGSGSTSTTWTAQFHNSATGGNNALMIRDDGRVGVSTNTMTGVLNIANTSTIDPRIWLQAPTNTEDANTLIDAKRPNGGNIFRFTDQGRFQIGNGVGF
jgi:hypothetical protein